MLHSDPNPIFDVGAPTSTGALNQVTHLCDVLGIALNLEPPRSTYMHGWGTDCLDAKPVVCSWTVTFADTQGNPTSFTFDIVKGDSPLVMGLDVGRHTDSHNLTAKPLIKILRPRDNALRILKTYIEGDDKRNPDCLRMRVELAPSPQSAICTLLTKLHTRATRAPKTLAKQLHRLTHAPSQQVKNLCRHAGILSEDLEDAIDAIDAACEVCARHGRPLPLKKISLTPVNEAFNEEIKIDFTYIEINGTTHTLIVITDTGTGYSESEIVAAKNVTTIMEAIDWFWICRHGTLKHASADDEYNRTGLRRFFVIHGI